MVRRKVRRDLVSVRLDLGELSLVGVVVVVVSGVMGVGVTTSGPGGGKDSPIMRSTLERRLELLLVEFGNEV